MECLVFLLFFMTLAAIVGVRVASVLNGGSESPAPRFDVELLAKNRGRMALRIHDVPSTVAGRADELARTIVNSVALGGPGILRTYVDDGAAEQLYADAVDLIKLVEGRGRLGIELWPPKVVRNPDAPIRVDVRYVLHPHGNATEKRVLRLERWFWGPNARRCEVCGAPNQTETGNCQYCGAAVADQQRWILREVVVTASPGAADLV